MLEITSSQLSEFCQTSTELVAKITDIYFDIEVVKKDIEDVISEVLPIPKDNQLNYKSLGLQYRDEKYSYYDSIESIFYVDDSHTIRIDTAKSKEWDKWNNLGDRVSYLHHPIYSLGLELYRTRLLQADPGFESVKHIDYDWRYHIPVTTNENCYLDYNGVKIHLPADGYAYVVNAGFMHSVHNLGDTVRTHYCGILNISNPGDRILNVNSIE